MAKPKALSDLTPLEVINDPAASHWLKNQLIALLERDVVDATNDAEALAQIMRAHCMKILSQ